jgi:transposase
VYLWKKCGKTGCPNPLSSIIIRGGEEAYEILRRFLVEERAKTDEILKGEPEADEAYLGGTRKGNRGRGARGRAIVYGIPERGDKVSVSVVQDLSAESLMTEML